MTATRPDFGPGIDNGICSMCGRAPATTEYVAPVCQPCHDWLVSLEGELAQLEQDDPIVGEAARKVDEVLKKLSGDRETVIFTIDRDTYDLLIRVGGIIVEEDGTVDGQEIGDLLLTAFGTYCSVTGAADDLD